MSFDSLVCSKYSLMVAIIFLIIISIFANKIFGDLKELHKLQVMNLLKDYIWELEKQEFWPY